MTIDSTIKEKAKNLRETGLTYQEIANSLKISYTSAWKFAENGNFKRHEECVGRTHRELTIDSNFTKWESLPLLDCRQIPSTSGIYLVSLNEKVLYVGRSKCMNKRWREGHHCLLDILRLGDITDMRIHFIETDYLDQELTLIRLWDPVVNKNA